mmetsp:Transcript_43733/g.138439  ORF Transcript_43733/g.138439 Transcript_43733/m.138439 type:complete len:318 (-) Transcript_43733:218-1171(-)
MDKDVPDLDNTLNMLSTLSMPLAAKFNWAEPLPVLKRLVGAAFGGDGVVVTAGGNCPAGVLGQVGGLLELAEQIEAGAMPSPDRIYLPIGSSCTTSGLILGVALARHLRLGPFGGPLRIVGVPVHEAFAMLQAKLGIHRASLSQYMPLTIRHTLKTTCAELARLGGPDLHDASLRILHEEVEILTDADLVGIYGAHSEVSRRAAQAYDATGRLFEGSGAEVSTPLWVCGHFVAKAFAPLIDDAAKEELRGQTFLLWQTKSAVQPLGTEDEWAQLAEMPPLVKRWADDGPAESTLRPGKVDTANGTPDDYRHLMKALP